MRGVYVDSISVIHSITATVLVGGAIWHRVGGAHRLEGKGSTFVIRIILAVFGYAFF
ncbi:hypothetical protein ANAPH1_00696 [Anaplasma phagocytophilum]|nr:hypothetical protein ANAPH1_00696 [Anaplasma phagocytophilum]